MVAPPPADFAAAVDAATDCVCFALRKAARAVSQRYDATLEASGLKATQLSLLAVLAVSGETTITRLAHDLVMDRTTLTRNLKPLERDGLIAVAPGHDRRTRVVALSPRGREALARALPLWRLAQSRMLARIGDDRWARLAADLAAIAPR